MSASPYESVWEFERQIASFTGAKYGVATDTCTSALFLCCTYRCVGRVAIPARTYISVPASIIHAGGDVDFVDEDWSGEYQLKPYDIWDCALRFRRGMYTGGLRCLSFQMKKVLPIGRGGMVLTDSEQDANWLRKARSNGRNCAVSYQKDKIDFLGWDMAMTPEQGARGLHLLSNADPAALDQWFDYPDLRTMPVFSER